MQTIAVLAIKTSFTNAIRSGLSGAYRPYWRRSRELLIDALKHGIGDGVIIELYERDDGDSVIPIIAEVRWLFPKLPIIGYADVTGDPKALRLIQLAARQGMTTFICHREDDVVATLQGAVPVPVDFKELLRSELDEISGNLVRQFCEYVLEHATRPGGDPVTVETAAVELQATPGQLARAFRDAGMNSPRWVLARVRMLGALSLLVSRGCCAEDAAQAFGYATGDTFRRAMLRATGYRARSLAGDGSGAAYAHMLGVVRGELQSQVLCSSSEKS